MSTQNEEVVGMVVKLAAESTDFQNQMSTLSRQMKVIQSEFKAAASGNKDYEKTMEGLATKSTYLNNAIKTQQSILEAHSTRLDKSRQRISDLAEAQVQLKSKLDSTKSSYEEAVRLYGEESEQAQKLANELKELQTQYDKNNDKINSTSKTIDNQTIAYNNARATMGNLEGQLKDTTEAMDKLGNEAQDANHSVEGMNNTGNPFSNFTGGVKEALGQTKIFGVSLGDLGGAISGTIDPTALMTGVIAGATAAFTELAVKAIQKAIEAMKQFIVEAMKLGETFQAQMSKVEAISGAVGSKVDDLTDAAREMGSQTVYSATEAAQGLEYMALAGWSAEESIQGLPSVLNLASSAGMDLGKASDIVTDYLTAFRLEIHDTQRLVDIMAYAMSNSNTNVEQLGEAYKNCAATCASFGLGVEESTAWLSKMADSGKKAGESGTALNSVLSRLYGQNKQATKALEEYGLSMFDVTGKAKPFTQVMGEIQKATEKMTDKQKDAFLRNVAGTQQLSAFNVMLAASADEVANFTNQLENANGTADRMSKTMNDNIVGLKKSINSKVEDIKISLYTAIEPIYSMVLKVGETLLNNFSQIAKPMSDLLAAILDPIRSIFNAFMDIIQLFNNKILPIMTGPLKILTSLLKGIGTVIKEICEIAVSGIEFILNALNPIIEVITWISDKIGTVFDVISNSFGKTFESMFDPINNIKYLNEALKLSLQEATGVFTLNADKVLDAGEKIHVLLNEGLEEYEKIYKKSSETSEEIAENFKTIAEICGESTDKVWTSFEEMYNKIQEIDDETYNQLKESADGYYNEYQAKLKGVSKYEEEQLNKKMEKWDSTHKSMEGSLNYYVKREEYYAKQVEVISNKTASKKESINSQYTSKMEQEFQKQQVMQKKYSESNYKGDYETFAKNEEAKTKKYLEELRKRTDSKTYESKTGGIGSGYFAADITGINGWGNTDIPRYANGTNFHPGGLAIVADGNGSNGELLNMPRGTQVHSNSDTGSLLQQALIPTNNILEKLDKRLTSLEQTQRDLAYQESALVNM